MEPKYPKQVVKENIQNIQNLMRIKQTQLVMLRDRNFDISFEENVLEYNFNNLNDIKNFVGYYSGVAVPTDQSKLKITRESLNRYYRKISTPNIITAVFYIENKDDKDKDIGVNTIKGILGEIQNFDSLKNRDLTKVKDVIKKIVMISPKLTSPSVKTSIGKNLTFDWQLFYDRDLMFNLTKHIWVPKHTALTKEETKLFLSSNKILKGQLPKIKYLSLVNILENKNNSVIDPVVRYYDFEPGQIIKIQRYDFITNTMARKSIFYRLVQ